MKRTLAQLHQRADSYKFLSECYYLPDETLIQKVIGVAGTDQFFAELCSCVSSDLVLESLKIDFTRLFVGPFKVLAPPYGSIYLEDGKIMGESTIDVRDWYEKEGLDVVINDAPDHITMELEFMYFLVTKQTQATNAGNLQDIQLYQQKQASFLYSHLSRWIPQFVKNVQENAQATFYKKLTSLTEMFVQKDLDACTLFDVQSVHSAEKGL